MKLKLCKSKLQKVLKTNRKRHLSSAFPIKNCSLSAFDKNKKKSIFPKKIECLQKQKAEYMIHNGSFHEAMSPVLMIAQFFAIMPVVNIRSKNPLDLYFSWKNYRCLYSLIITFMSASHTCITIYWFAHGTIVISEFTNVIFYASNTCVLICFIFLAKKWPDLMKQWSFVESKLPKYHTQKEKENLAHKIKIISITILTASLTEHLLSIISTISQPFTCEKSEHPIQDFLEIHLKEIFAVTTFTPIKAVLAKLINTICVFAWSFMDLFVMLISLGLTTRFHQINKWLLHSKGKVVPKEFWATYRINYRELCNLCEVVDNAIAIITLVSFSNNIYFICFQLLKSINPKPTIAVGIYFWFSLIYLISRTLAVSLYAADIFTESRRPIKVFRSVPTESWCLEVKRFSSEVIDDIVALSGMKFFYLTKRLVLSVAGTIVTYELVLMQFQEETQIITNTTLCK